MTTSIIKVIDGIKFTLGAETHEAAEAARITLTDLAAALGYSDKAQLKLLAGRHASELADFGETFTVKVYQTDQLNRVKTFEEQTYNPDQAAYLALSSETEQGRKCRVRILKAYKALLNEVENLCAPKPLTKAQQALASAQALVEIEERQEAQASAIVQLEAANVETQRKLDALIAEPDAFDWQAISVYAQRQHISLRDRADIPLGRRATKLSEDRGYEVRRVRVPGSIYFEVNSYHLDILREVFAEAGLARRDA